MTTGCGGGQRPVRIGINPWPGYETLYLAAERGIFAKHGLRIELKEYSSLGDARRAYERGHIDGMACTLVEVLQARHQSDRSPAVILVADYSLGADVILARPGIGSVQDLRGKRVAVEIASLGLYMISRAVNLSGMRLADIQLRPADQTEVEEEARSGRVDAVVTYPPISDRVTALGWRPVFDSRAIPGEVVDVVAVDRAVLEPRPGFQKAFLEAMAEVIGLLETDRAESVRLMAARERISPAEFERSLSLIELVPVADMPRQLAKGGPVEAIARKLAAVLEQNGQLLAREGAGSLVAPVAAWER